MVRTTRLLWILLFDFLSLQNRLVESFVSTRILLSPSNGVQRFMSAGDSSTPLDAHPKLIVFDLDGCLWKPEMYELSWYGKGSPFSPDEKGNMISSSGDKVYLLGNVRGIFTELYTQQQSTDTDVSVGVSSRTDAPDWARELLDKFLLEDAMTPMASVLNGPIVISYDSKTKHFRRISSESGIALEDMIFFDNERGNCVDVAKLGVTVAYVPNGVTNKLYQAAIDAFPAQKGKIVNIDL